MTRSRKWLIGVLIFIGLVTLVLYFFNWNLLRGYVERKVQASTGRSFAINGDLHVRPSFHPRVTADGIVLGNAAWNPKENMAEIERLDFTFNLLSLLRRPIVFREIRLSKPRIVLEKNREGLANWEFNADNQSDSSSLPVVEALVIDDGSLVYRDPTKNTDVAIEVATAPATANDAEPMLNVRGRGRYEGATANIAGSVGSLLSLRDTSRPYPLKIRAQMGSTTASAEGGILDPLHLGAQDFNFTLEGSDLSLLFPLIGVPIPPTSSYKLAGHLNHNGNVWTFKQFKGVVGKSDLSGDFSVDRGKNPQLLTADLTSHNLDMNDLGGFIGAKRGERPSPVPPDPDHVLPREPFDLTKLRAADADVKFKGEKIVTQKLPLGQLNVHLVLSGGVLKLDPMSFTIAKGNLVSQISMDSRQNPIATNANIQVKSLHLEELFPATKLTAANAGTIGGRLQLRTTGNAINQMMGSANGEAALIMDGGSVSELILRLTNLDVANAIGALLRGDNQLPARCMVSQWKAVNGDFQAEALVLDTTKVNVQGTGNVNFKDETLNLRLVAKPKGFSLVSLRGPILITGTFKKPAVRPEMGQVITRGALAAALGIATTGLAAFIPLLAFGGGEDSNCAALISQAQTDVGTRPADRKR